MNIFTASQIKEIDLYTCKQESITSLELMERAANTFVETLLAEFPTYNSFSIFCGLGNNGGDGLAIAHILHEKYNKTVKILALNSFENASIDTKINFNRISSLIDIQIVNNISKINIDSESLVIDALLGTGTNRPVTGTLLEVINRINNLNLKVVSVDIPSGMFADTISSDLNAIVKAHTTITFQFPKQSFCWVEHAPFLGNIIIKNIHLNTTNTSSNNIYYIDKQIINKIYKPRAKSSHKGTYGHALLITGSLGMIGASVISGKACVRAGAGKTTIHIPSCGYNVLQTAVPEAMIWSDYSTDSITTTYKEITEFDAVGIGPGIGKYKKTKEALSYFLRHREKPLLLDADALNIIADNKEMLTEIPQNSILTPHIKEFERLFGSANNSVERIELAKSMALKYKINIILKNSITTIVLNNGAIYYNPFGNAGLAKGGSGDALTGILTALLAQGYTTHEASVLGTYLLGRTAEICIEQGIQSLETLCATDVCEHLHKTFREIAMSLSE